MNVVPHAGASNLHGTLPEELGLLTSLRALAVDDNFLSGALPRSLARLSALTTLNAQMNLLTGTVPSVWFDGLGALEVLDLDSNFLRGGLEGIGRLGELRRLNVFDNGFGGTVPADIGDLTALGTWHVLLRGVPTLLPVLILPCVLPTRAQNTRTSTSITLRATWIPRSAPSKMTLGAVSSNWR